MLSTPDGQPVCVRACLNICCCRCRWWLQIFEEPAAAFAGRAYVHPRRRFGAAAEEDEGNDVYMCEYEYDESWQRFRRRNYDGGAAANGAGGAPSPLTPRALRGGFTNDDSDAGSDSDREFALDGPGSDADSDGDNEACDASYRPELFGGLRGGWLGGKRKRHGQLPSEVLAAAAAAQRVRIVLSWCGRWCVSVCVCVLRVGGGGHMLIQAQVPCRSRPPAPQTSLLLPLPFSMPCCSLRAWVHHTRQARGTSSPRMRLRGCMQH